MSQNLGREIILAIGENMRGGLEPLLTRTLAPSLYQVYLHPDDYDHLQSIFPQIEEEALLHLQQQLEELNRGPLPVVDKVRERLPGKILGSAPTAESKMRYEPAGGGWYIRFQEDPNESLQRGEIEVVSEMAVGEEPRYAEGSKTQRIAISTTRRLGRSQTQRNLVGAAQIAGQIAGHSAGQSAGQNSGPTSAQNAAGGTDDGEATAATRVLAEFSFSDDGGPQRYAMTKEEIFIGRGARDVWVDLRLRTKPDVSRRHVKVRRDAAGRFWITEMSQFGTKVNGEALRKGTERQLGLSASIDLASVLTLHFQAMQLQATELQATELQSRPSTGAES